MCFFAKRVNSESNFAQIKLEITGEVGAPWGNEFLKMQIWAKTVAAYSGRLNGLAWNNPQTLPKFIEGKKSLTSTFKTYFLSVCLEAPSTISRSLTKP